MRTSTILVAESDHAICSLFDDVLCMAGYEVRLRSPHDLSSNDVLAASPDLLLLELNPDTARHQLALIARLRHPTVGVPVLVTTTDPALLKHYRVALRTLDCAMLLKPFSLDDLLAVVDQQLSLAA